ncbi:MAG: flippase-like domain-containing protein [Balneolales bacterium]|nr:flippase-like domain-containing protein [Balneolales bacterium]
MRRHILHIALSLCIAGLFIWLSFRNVEINELKESVRMMSYGWLFPYFIVCMASFWLRSERWRLMVSAENSGMRSSTFFTGVMLGYSVNYAVPRLGEISRTLFVSRNERVSGSKVFGTVVLERILDLLAMLVMLFFVILFVVADRSTMDALFGPQLYLVLDELRSPLILGLLFLAGLLSLYLCWKAVLYILQQRRKSLDSGMEHAGLKRILFSFTDGLTSIRKLKKWPVFLLYTALMWICYGLMTYIPFYAFDIQNQFGLGIGEAFAVMVISTIGVSLPSPGGIGTYHWFVTQSLLVLYAVPAVTGLSYALVTHAGMMSVVLLVTPVAWLFTYYRYGITKKNEPEPAIEVK